ncbi:hypothetical protein BJV78DRAFT_1232611 [Lactifluus subvellereus]|nr:hypothetical protein BJV78DRAFT_1232611 [Lactifluus subvellereus]
MDKEGQDHNAVHIATAMFRGQPVGQARGNSKGAAKHDAAEIVLATLIQGPKNLLSVQTGTLSEFFHTIFPTYPVDPQPNSTDLDPAVALNNFLQSHETGDLTPHFHWVMDKDGQDHNAVHIATAMFRDQPVGQGRGTSKSAAKHDAAEIVLANGMVGVR